MYTNVCRFCGRMFMSRAKSTVCQECKAKDDEIFSKIEEYLKQYPNSNAMQISEGLELSVVEVLRYIDEGRLQIAKGEFHKL